MKYKRNGSDKYISSFSREYTDITSGNNKHEGYVDIYSSDLSEKRKKRKFPWGRVISFLFFLTLGLIGAVMLYAHHTLNSFNYDNSTEMEYADNVEPDGDEFITDSMVLNILLIGSDSMSVGDGGRSDSTMILSLDLRHKKIKITSLMRDLWVSIPGHSSDRLNAAYAFGGPKLTCETIKRNFGVVIDRYAVVDFEGFSKIIDALGGIDIELSSAECAYINKYSGDKHTLKGSGLKHLTGLQALHYSRDRNSAGSDYDRTSRQRTVVKTVISKMKTAKLTQITELISTLAPLVTTNFQPQEISKLATKSITYLNFEVSEFRLPTNDNVRNETYSKKMVLVINNPAKAKADLINYIYENGVTTKAESTTVGSSENSKSKTTTSTKSNATTKSNTSQSKTTSSAKSTQSTTTKNKSTSDSSSNSTSDPNTTNKSSSTSTIDSAKATASATKATSSTSTSTTTKSSTAKPIS